MSLISLTPQCSSYCQLISPVCVSSSCCLRWHTALGNQAAACNLILTVPFGACSVGTAWVGGSGLLGSLLSVSSGWLAFPSLLLAFPLRPWSGVLVLRKSPLVSFSEVSRCYAFINFSPLLLRTLSVSACLSLRFVRYFYFSSLMSFVWACQLM